MNCEEAREAMLVADIGELRGADGPLASHVASCDGCRARADVLRADLDVLANAVLNRAATIRPKRSRPVLVGLLAGLPIAAALIVGVSLAARDKQTHTPTIPSVPTSKSVSVDVSPGQQTAVFATSDPNVTIVWLSPGVGQ